MVSISEADVRIAPAYARFWGKVDMTIALRNLCFDLKRTSNDVVAEKPHITKNRFISNVSQASIGPRETAMRYRLRSRFHRERILVGCREAPSERCQGHRS